MDVGLLKDLAASFGFPVSIMLAILWAGSKGKWVYGKTYDREVARGDKWEALYIEQREIQKASTGLAAEVVEVLRREGLTERRRGGGGSSYQGDERREPGRERSE